MPLWLRKIAGNQNVAFLIYEHKEEYFIFMRKCNMQSNSVHSSLAEGDSV